VTKISIIIEAGLSKSKTSKQSKNNARKKTEAKAARILKFVIEFGI